MTADNVVKLSDDKNYCTILSPFPSYKFHTNAVEPFDLKQ